MAKDEDQPRPRRGRGSQPPPRAARALKTIERARRAKALMDDPLMIEALDNIDKIIDKGWKQSSAEDVGARDRAYWLHRIMVQFRAHFEQVIRDGANAAKLLQFDEESQSARGREP